MNTQSKITPTKEQDKILREIIDPLIQLQDPVTLVQAIENFRAAGYAWANDCLMPDYECWAAHLPNEQITWLGDDCLHFAKTIAGHGFPALEPGIAHAIRNLGTDNPTVLANGIFEYAKTLVSPFEASLFTFGVIQLMRGDQFAFQYIDSE
jgi:hypothetical protein